ncbi:MAG: RES family NAD+ phosphorylase [Actinobacteria bacterium]|nr:RES family NAD+ phosphorylase [Actinomycetota bacterium]
MTKLPEQPDLALLAALGPEEHLLDAGTQCWRVYFKGGAHPTQWNSFRDFGPTGSRFDHHVPPRHSQTRAVLYGAVGHTAVATCLAEVFQDTRTINRSRRDPWLVVFELTREVRLHSLCGLWPTRAGASTNISSGPKHKARNWSRAIYETYGTIEGLYFGSSMNANEPAFALYERAVAALPLMPAGNWSLADSRLDSRLNAAGTHLNYRVWPP